MIELARLVGDFASGLQQADQRRPQAVGLRTGKAYQPGIGPHTEAQTVRLVLAEMIALDKRYNDHELDVPYPGSRQRCDWCIGMPPNRDWAIEVKLLRLMGDNGKPNDNMLTHILSPYPAHRSALTDCQKLNAEPIATRKAILIFGYDYAAFDMEPAIEAFETLARRTATLGPRHTAHFQQLVHPVHQQGRVFAWELGPNKQSGQTNVT